MKLSRFLFLFLFLVYLPIQKVSGQSYAWATKGGSTGSDMGMAVTTDLQRNIYSLGFFTSANITFGSGPSAITLNSAGGKDLYLLKQNCLGVPVWAVRIGSSADEAGSLNYGDLVIDDTTGALYLTASFSGNCSFGTTSGAAISKTAAGNYDAFIARYSTNGIINWVNTIGSADNDQGCDIILDTSGNLICSGLFSSNASFGTQSGSAGSLTSAGNTDGYIARYSKSGQFLNAVKVGGTVEDVVLAINLDRSANIIASIGTCCSGNVQVGPFTLNNTGAWGGVVAKLNANMSTWLWATHIGGNGNDVVGFPNIDDSNNVYAMFGSESTSSLQSSAGGSFAFTPSSMDLIFAKFNPSGVLQWAQKIGGSGYEQPYCSWYDSKRKKFYWGGWFGNTVTFGTAPNTQTISSIGGRDQFIAEYNIDGSFNWVLKGGSPGDDLATKIITDTAGAIYFTGFYTGNGIYGPFFIGSSGSADANICKIAVPYTIDSIYAGRVTLCGNSDSIQILSGGIKPGTASLQWLLNNSPIPGATAASVYASAAGQYKLIGTNSCGDKDTSNTLSINRVLANAGPDFALCKGDSVQIQGTALGSYSWAPSTGLSNPFVINPYVKNTITTSFVLSSTIGACTVKDTLTVMVLDCPRGKCTYASLASTSNMVVNGNFQAGNSGFTSDLPQSLVNPLPNATYVIGTSGQAVHFAYKGNDHTTGSGNMMIVNGGSGLINVWCQQVAVQPNTFYRFSAWFNNIVDHVNYPNSPIAYLELRINGIKISKNIPLPDVPDNWVLLDTLWYSGNNTMANLCIVDTSTSLNGNDFAVDDISFKRCCDLIASAGPDKTITPGDSVQLEGEAPGATSIRWQPASLVNDSTLTKPYAKPSINTPFVFKANSSGCIKFDTVWVFLDSASCVDCSSAGSINSGLVACYTFDGNANDKSGNGNHGIIHGGLSSTNDRWGNPSKAYDFNGTDAYISVPNSVSLSSPSAEITISAWVYVRNWKAISPSSNYAPVLAKSDNANTLQYVMAFIDSGINACHEGRLAELNKHPIQKNKWYNLAFTVNSAQLVKYYLDGILLDSTTSQTVPLFTLSKNNPLYIGRDEPVSTEYLDGKLDDIRIYNRALSSTEIRRLYHSNLFEDFADAGPDSTICNRDSIQLLGKGGNFYAWHKANGLSDTSLQKPFVKPSVNTEYVLEVSKGACRDKDSVQINITKLSVNAGVDTSFCIGDSVQLNALAPGALSWTWSPATGLSNIAIPNPYAQPVTASMYVISVSNGNCSAKDTIHVNPYSISVNAGRDSSICPGDSVQLGLSSDGDTFTWSPATGLSTTNILHPKAAPASSQSYILTASQKQCRGYDTVTLTVLPRPSVTTSDTIVCINNPVKISAQSNDPNVRYKWNTGDTLSFLDIIAQQSSKFWVQVNNGNCKSEWDTALVTVEKAPNPSFTADPISGKAPLLVNFSAAPGGSGKYYWHFGDTSAILGRGKDTSYEYQDTGTYVVKLITESPRGCKDSAFALITAFDTLTLFIPSAFSPNGDGINDLWYPSITGMKYYELIIFDRWGEILYQQDSRKGWPAWNGKFKDELVPDGVYAYLLRYISEKRGGGQKIGTITIIH